jgi:alcohol dehydrogenase, propanol-preferring
MRAWLLKEQARMEERPLQLEDIPEPRARDDEIRLKILVCGICRTDIHIAEGDLALKKSPLILGHEIVGVVDEVGKNVKLFKTGDRAGVFWLYSSCKKCKYCLSQKENYCPDFRATGWDEDGGYAEYITIPEDYALPLNHVKLEPREIAPLMCPGIAGYAAFKLTEAKKGYKLGLYGFGPTAYFVLKIANSLGIETHVSTRSLKNIERAKKEGAHWAGDSSREKMPCKLDAAIIFPPAGNLVEPTLSQLENGGTLVLAPVSSTPINIDNYSENLWGRSIKTLYNINRGEANEFINMVEDLDLNLGTSLFPFEELQDALIRVKQGKTEQPNAVIKVAG